MTAMLILKELTYIKVNRLNYFNTHYHDDNSFHIVTIHLKKRKSTAVN
jgi:hypothetical protein